LHRQRVHEVKGNVRFLAASTLLRFTIGQNQDSYLAELSFKGQEAGALVRLIDAYPSYAPPLSNETLRSRHGIAMRVSRDPVCDIRFGDLLLRAAPGDPVGIVPGKLVYSPQLERMPARDDIIPCYRTVRH